VHLVAFGWIAVLAVAYVLWIGPGDYLLLRRFGRQWWRTWITFPLSILLITGLVLYLNRRGQGEVPQANQLDVVDVDLASGTWRGTAWAHVHTPRPASLSVRYDVTDSWQSDSGATHELISWHGLPGDSFGGMDGPRRDVFPSHTYRIGVPTAETSSLSIPSKPPQGVTGVALPAGGTRAFRARWWKSVPPTSASTLAVTSSGHLGGVVVNELPVRLRDAKLLFGRWYYDLEDMEPRGRVDLDDGMKPRSLRNWLARREVVDGRDIATPWDQTSLDIPRILEMLMFHERAGGYDYTGLSHQYQDWLDLSGQLTSGRAILVGRLESAPTAWNWEPAVIRPSTEEHWAFARVVIPVEAKGMSQFD
jgi:hypothetical protein